MVNAILFDFGDIFINKNKEAQDKALADLGLAEWTEEHDKLERKFETGKISADGFLKALHKDIPNATLKEIKAAWNAGIDDFPLYRLEFLQKLSEEYRLFLLSNTDPIHIEKFERDVEASFYMDFYQCFEKVYFSHEIGYRKPDAEAFNFVLNKHDIQAKRTLVIDDKKYNTDAAAALGFQVWNLDPKTEDVVDLFEKKVINLDEV
ncbi:HAD-IA family hydrolase [Flavobacterium sp. NRK1]|jgi:putative hydrolase of the HAD superfamily|uniref:HAD-IA family hydrolase n=1 Tax=Flavobacterium sp. NRK1 TaxID=2954929 RepID=UPI0020920D14|nr:HAD-IA family hydrolase [Flavobacterium sp. NRK1]MCO6148415.1 HAD-IA family hydrolase [Flavobacterium sp. NRK1]